MKEEFSCIDIKIVAGYIFCSPEWNKLEDVHHAIIKQNLLHGDRFLFGKFKEYYKTEGPRFSYLKRFKLKKGIKNKGLGKEVKSYKFWISVDEKTQDEQGFPTQYLNKEQQEDLTIVDVKDGVVTLKDSTGSTLCEKVSFIDDSDICTVLKLLVNNDIDFEMEFSLWEYPVRVGWYDKGKNNFYAIVKSFTLGSDLYVVDKETNFKTLIPLLENLVA